MPSLFETYSLAGLELRNRVVMAPMTRSRAVSLSPNEGTVLYYRQRAGAGLIITEGTHISEESRGQVFTPGIYTPEQIAAWRKVTDAVHEEGGAIFVQLWHCGRNSHVSHQPGRKAPVSSVARRSNTSTWAFSEDGSEALIPTSEPRALETDEVARVTADFVQAARNAIEAGFDGIELHGANGYLFEQFINGELNQRADKYGGSIENRIRFTLETVDAVAGVIGKDKTGIRLAPYGRFGDMKEYPDEEQTWLTLGRELAKREIAYVHISDQASLGEQAIPEGFLNEFRKTYPATLIVAGNYTKARGQTALDAGRADLIAFGRPYIANPDLVERLRNDLPLAEIDRSTLYTRTNTGYIDYPVFSAAD